LHVTVSGSGAGGDDVGQGEAPAGGQHAGGLDEDAGLVRAQVDHAVGDDHVERGVVERQLFQPAVDEPDVRGAGAQPVGLGTLGVGHVDAGDLPGRPDPVGGGERVGARPAAQVQHPRARGQGGEVEGVPDPGERREGLGRDGVEQVGRVAEPLGQGPAEREVELGGRLLRHLPVERLDLADQFGRVELGRSGHRGLRSTSQAID